MNKRVLKYSVKIGEEAVIPLPKEAWILHCACQFSAESVEFWVEVDMEWDQTDDPPKVGLRKFQIIGTGSTVPESAEYRGTALSPDGRFVWHLYEIGE